MAGYRVATTKNVWVIFGHAKTGDYIESEHDQILHHEGSISMRSVASRQTLGGATIIIGERHAQASCAHGIYTMSPDGHIRLHKGSDTVELGCWPIGQPLDFIPIPQGLFVSTHAGAWRIFIYKP